MTLSGVKQSVRTGRSGLTVRVVYRETNNLPVTRALEALEDVALMSAGAVLAVEAEFIQHDSPIPSYASMGLNRAMTAARAAYGQAEVTLLSYQSPYEVALYITLTSSATAAIVANRIRWMHGQYIEARTKHAEGERDVALLKLETAGILKALEASERSTVANYERAMGRVFDTAESIEAHETND